jgi:hypothetical protein
VDSEESREEGREAHICVRAIPRQVPRVSRGRLMERQVARYLGGSLIQRKVSRISRGKFIQRACRSLESRASISRNVGKTKMRFHG